jgi:hypothetical protein
MSEYDVASGLRFSRRQDSGVVGEYIRRLSQNARTHEIGKKATGPVADLETETRRHLEVVRESDPEQESPS